MGYSDRTESAESKILYEWYSLPQNLDLCDANETPLSSRSEQCGEGGGAYTLLSLHGHGRRCRI